MFPKLFYVDRLSRHPKEIKIQQQEKIIGQSLWWTLTQKSPIKYFQ